jgi:hypothetical protein
MKIRYLVISVIIHAFLFLSLSVFGGGGGGNGNSHNKDGSGLFENNESIMPKIVEIEAIERSNKSDIIKKMVVPKPDVKILHKCVGNHWYGGVGIAEDSSEDSIRVVASGYPADRAGIKVGDQVMLIDGLPGTYDLARGNIGTPVTITVKRGDQQISFTMIREKICTVEEESSDKP